MYLATWLGLGGTGAAFELDTMQPHAESVGLLGVGFVVVALAKIRQLLQRQNNWGSLATAEADVPLLVYYQGRFLPGNMSQAGVNFSELLTAAHAQHITSLVGAVGLVLEPSGRLTLLHDPRLAGLSLAEQEWPTSTEEPDDRLPW